MKLTFDYDHSKYGKGSVTTLPVDVMKWERMTKQKVTELYREDAAGNTYANIGISDMVTMVYAVLHRKGTTTDTLDVFVEGLESVEFGDDEPTDPTLAGASPADS